MICLSIRKNKTIINSNLDNYTVQADKYSGKVISFRVKCSGFKSMLCHIYQPQPLWISYIKWDDNLGLISSQGFLRELHRTINVKKCFTSCKVLHAFACKGNRMQRYDAGRPPPTLGPALYSPAAPGPVMGDGGWALLTPPSSSAVHLSGLGWLREQLKHFKCTSISKSNLNWPPNPFVIFQFGAC